MINGDQHLFLQTGTCGEQKGAIHTECISAFENARHEVIEWKKRDRFRDAFFFF